MSSSFTESMPLRIAGVGRYLPERTVSSEALEREHHLPAGWCIEKQGVRERRWVDTETAASMGAAAAREALADAGTRLEDVDLIINASGSPQQAVPDGGPLLQDALGLGRSGVPSFSINASCLSFFEGVQVAALFLNARRARNVLVVASDVSSCALDFDTPENFTLFGDAAAAVVLSLPKPTENSTIHVMQFATYGYGAEYSMVPGGGSLRHPNSKTTRREDNHLHMNGRELLKMAFDVLPAFNQKMWRAVPHLSIDDIKYIVPHQPSRVVLDYFSMHYPEDKIIRVLERFGNCIGASMPLALYEAVRFRNLARGDSIVLTGTGSGVSFAGAILTF